MHVPLELWCSLLLTLPPDTAIANNYPHILQVVRSIVTTARDIGSVLSYSVDNLVHPVHVAEIFDDNVSHERFRWGLERESGGLSSKRMLCLRRSVYGNV